MNDWHSTWFKSINTQEVLVDFKHLPRDPTATKHVSKTNSFANQLTAEGL